MSFIRRVLFRSFSNNFKPASKLRVNNDAFRNIFENRLDEINWEDVRKELMVSERYINARNLDAIVIEKCSKDIRIDVAKSYVNFLKSKSFEINDVSIGKFLRLFYRHQRKINDELGIQSASEEDEAEIRRFCNLLIEKHQILDATLAENVIHGLCVTREWIKTLDLLRQIQVTSSVNQSTYCCIVLKALEENRLDIVWNLIKEMNSKQIAPSATLLLKYFSMFQRDDAKMEQMLEVLRKNSILLSEKRINSFIEVFSETRNCEIVKINRSGKCPACSNNLEAIELNENEFSKLSNTFLNNVMICRDVFLKTTPDELERFKNFVYRVMPFDCVIDGLNVAFSHGTTKDLKMRSQNIASVVKYFVDRNKQCLVIGRQHMAKWPKYEMEYIRRNSILFLADDISQDDPFMLYAALKNGPHTKIFSRDLMRSHSFLLDDESKKLFRRWQQQSQYSLITTLSKNEILVREPITFELRTHKVKSCWHIPFTSENINFTHETFELPSSWLCVKFSS